ncbi:hypothetical protein E4T47_03135 [Aureobasidium subglaciale]|nr:hypothetical protein E4T47_03135 [Aureobasidium subglaciale]
MFINIQFPSDTQKGHLRRAIRSQAALSSADCRKSTIAAKTATNSNDPEAIQKLVRVRRRSKAKAIKAEPEAHNDALILIQSTHSSSSSTLSSPVEPSYSLVPSLGQWNTQHDPFLSLPYGDAWHPTIPRLVDIYLTYYAPDVQDPIYASDRPVLRRNLWPEALSHSALFFASLLVATSHASFEQTPEVLAYFRFQAMRNVQAVLDLSAGFNTSDQLIAAVCLLSGWEFSLGDKTSAKAHMAGLKTMVNLRGGFHDADFPPVIRRLVSFVTYDQPWFAGIEPVFVPHGLKHVSHGDVLGLDLPLGFASLIQPNGLCSVAPSTLGFVSEINAVMKRSRHRRYALLDLQSRLAEYNFLDNMVGNFCPIHSSVDDTILVQAETHVKLALLCLVAHLQGDDLEQQWDLSKFLVSSVLVNTIYAEIGAWALFVICSTAQIRSPILLDGLEMLLSSLSITNWSLADQTLRRYLFPDTLDVATRALWGQITPNKPTMPGYNNLSRFHVATYRRDQQLLF